MKYKPKLRKTAFSRPQLLIFILAFALIGYLIFRTLAASNPNLPGDLNNDNTVNVTDLSILLSSYGTTNSSADINGDGSVNVLDMSVLLSNYGKTYTPTASFTTSLTSGMTITPPYTWTFNPGVTSVKGYFWADGVLLGTASPNSSGTYTFAIQTTTLTAGAHTLGHAWDLADGTHQSPPSSYPVTINTTTPPPPPPTGTIYFDGRAKNMTVLSSTGYAAPDGSIGTIKSVQSPQTWDCLCFTNNSISLYPDSRYTQVYKVYEGPGDRNPWNNSAPANDASGQLSKVKNNDLGKWDWYAIAIKVPTGWQNPDWSSIISLGYETIQYDQFSLTLNPGPTGSPPIFQIYQNAGLLTYNSGGYKGQVIGTQATLGAATFDQWQEFIFGIKWATDYTGAIEVYTRMAGQSTWQHPVELLNRPTEAYGSTNYTTCSADLHDCATNLDKMGLYYGYWDTTRTSFPYETLYETGFTRSSDLQTAQSTLP